MVTVTPPPNFFGNLTLTCTVTTSTAAPPYHDRHLVGVASVNDAPVAVDDTAEVNQSASVDIDVVGNDLDVEGDRSAPSTSARCSPAGADGRAQPQRRR